MESLRPKMESEHEMLEKYNIAIEPLIKQLSKLYSLCLPIYIVSNGKITAIERIEPTPEIQEMIDKVIEMIEFVRESVFKSCASNPLHPPEDQDQLSPRD